jgi:hypothetical protein
VALPTERTWATLDDLDSTNLNAGIRDVLTFLMQRPVFQGRQTVAQGVVTSTFSPLTFTTEDIDSHTGHSTSSDTSRYVAPEDGWYQVSGGISFESNATGVRVGVWWKNGTTINGSRVDVPAISGGQAILTARTMLISLSAGDYVELVAWQNSGGTRNTVVTTENQSSMTVQWIRRL